MHFYANIRDCQPIFAPDMVISCGSPRVELEFYSFSTDPGLGSPSGWADIVGAGFSACPSGLSKPAGRWKQGGLRPVFPIRLGGDCGGGLPACPSGLLKPAGRCRESAGYRVLWDLRFLPSSPAFRDAVTLLRPGVPASHHRRGRAWVDCEGCDHADGAPAASLVAGRARQHRASRGSPVGICAEWAAAPRGCSGTNADPAPRWGVVFRVSSSVSVQVPHQVGRILWGRASSLPVRLVEAGRALPRECGVSGLVGSPVPDPSSPAFRDAVTLLRPGVPASHHRRGRAWVDCEGCDHADGAPAASLVAGRADRIALPGGARSAFVLSGPLRREVVPAQMRTRHPDGAWFSACPHRFRSRFPIRLGGYCGGGLPACPSGLLKPAARALSAHPVAV